MRLFVWFIEKLFVLMIFVRYVEWLDKKVWKILFFENFIVCLGLLRFRFVNLLIGNGMGWDMFDYFSLWLGIIINLV